MKPCSVCGGRGEVAAMVSLGARELMNGTAEPVGYAPNPAAWDKRINDVWLLESNPNGKLFGIAVCMACKGCGLSKELVAA